MRFPTPFDAMMETWRSRVSLLGHLILFSALVGVVHVVVELSWSSFTSGLSDPADAGRRLSGSQYLQKLEQGDVRSPEAPFFLDTYVPNENEGWDREWTPAEPPPRAPAGFPRTDWRQSLFQFVVYMIGAFVYKKKMLDPKPKLQEIAHNERGDFKHELFQCSKTPELALYGCCCAGCRAGDTYESAGVLGFWPVVVSFVCCPVGYACVMAPILRGKLREKFGGRGVGVSDWFHSVCCLCCTIVQEANTVDDEAGVQAKCFLKLDNVEVTAPPSQVQLSSFQGEEAA